MVGANVWISYFLYSASFHSPLWIRRSVTSVTWGLSSMPEHAASFPTGVSEISLYVNEQETENINNRFQAKYAYV